MSKYASMACALMWPLLVLLLHDDVGSWPLLVIGAALLAWRMPQARYLAAAAAVLLVALGGLGHAELGMRAYPVAVNAVMLAIFLSSLWRGVPVIERLARLREPELPAAGIRYTRNVTWAWCGFFILNGAIASWTALYASLATWTLYNGAISYGLIAVMFTGEWLIRHQLRSRLT
ncbi:MULTISPECIES: hypothetical protein [unclassified Halomonas]|uniref:COG4648 family protein n=1 Tax=unclassified Halomonas TaxID=2609666 RepID=UPI001D0335BB|nr:hypothetical protein [Halomonas sp. 3F2F]